MRASEQTKNYSKPYLTNINTKMKAKKVGEERCNHKIIPRRVIEEKTEELGKKPLHRPPNGN